MKSSPFFRNCAAFAVVSALLLAVGMLALPVNAQQAEDAAKAAPLLRHVVLFGFKEEATAEDIKKVEEAFAALPGKIDVIKGYEWGTNVSPENLDQGHTHCFFLTFANEKDRDAYLVHPAHKEFGGILRPYLAKVTVVDYFVKP